MPEQSPCIGCINEMWPKTECLKKCARLDEYQSKTRGLVSILIPVDSYDVCSLGEEVPEDLPEIKTGVVGGHFARGGSVGYISERL